MSKIIIPDFSGQLENYINELDNKQLVPRNMSRGYFILRAMGEDVSFFPGKVRIHLDDYPKKLIFEDTDGWTGEWRELWPTRGQLADDGFRISYDIRSSQKAIDKKMKSFLRDFYSRLSDVTGKIKEEKKIELIFHATKLYLEEQRQKGWEYTKKAMYFIEKNGDSVLEHYIRRIINGDEAPGEKNHYIT